MPPFALIETRTKYTSPFPPWRQPPRAFASGAPTGAVGHVARPRDSALASQPVLPWRGRRNQREKALRTGSSWPPGRPAYAARWRGDRAMPRLPLLADSAEKPSFHSGV